MAKTFYSHPDAGLPEFRRGTRSFRAYARYCSTGHPGGMTAALASPRKLSKAFKLAQGDAPKVETVKGRVMRACLRHAYSCVGEDLDARYYGHP